LGPAGGLAGATSRYIRGVGFEVLRDETAGGVRTLFLNAPPPAWENFQPGEAEVSQLSLEDIFIALVGSGTPAL